MDIRKLQRAIVDGLEDVKAQDILVFNTEHLSALFERVIIATGSSNRQTKALASSVRDAVKGNGFPVLATEGGDNGEWIIVDCGAAVAHIMQPAIREYYRLEEIWGGKPVRLKAAAEGRKGLVKAEEVDEDDDAEDPVPAARSAGRKSAAGKKAAGKAAADKKAPARAPAGTAATTTASAKAPARKAAAGKTAAAKSPARRTAPRPAGDVSAPATQTVVVKPAVRKTAGGAAPAKPRAGRTTTAKAGAGRAAPTKTSAGRAAPAKKAAARKAAPRRS